MDKVFIARQEIVDIYGKVYAYELLYRDHANGIKEFPTNIKATSHVLINTVTNISIKELIGDKKLAFINVDEDVLKSSILDILDKDKFVLEILETTDLSDAVITKIKQYHRRGFKIVIDDFDCSSEMIKKFTPLFKYIIIIKMDVLAAEPQNLKNVMSKLKKSGIKLLAEKVETKEEYNEYIKMGFDLFQGYYLSKPEVIEIDRHKESAQIVILQLIKIIKEDGHTSDIEEYIKLQPELSYKLLSFLNNQSNLEVKVESITQVITVLGRAKLLRWLMIYLYSEISTNPASDTILKLAINRAESMEADVPPSDKDKAYLAGMFSMLGILFETDINDLMKHVNMDKEITSLVVHNKGKFTSNKNSRKVYAEEFIIIGAKNE